MKKTKVDSWFAKLGRISTPPNAPARLSVESLNARVLPSVAGGACMMPPAGPPVACEVSHAKPVCKGAVEHGTLPRGDQHSICLYGVQVGKGQDKSSHGKSQDKSSHGKGDVCKPVKPPKPVKDCSKSNGGKHC